MLSKIFPEKLPSLWRLGLLQLLLIVSTVALCISQASWVMRRNLNSVARAVVLDDLGEYAVFYNRHGLGEITPVFAAGKHEEDQAVRITSPEGQLVFERIPPAVEGYDWPASAPKPIPATGSVLFTVQSAEKQHVLLIGCRRLDDGNILWFGRTDEDDAASILRIRQKLWLAGLASTVVMLLPLMWFARHVVRPVQAMVIRAEALAEGRTDDRMVAPAAMPELQSFATAYNNGLDRIADLTTELQDANDMLAHELRTPLARIRGNLESILDRKDPEFIQDAAARGIDEIDRASELIQTILTTRAGEHKALKLHLEECDLQGLLRRLCELYQPAAEERGLRLNIDAPFPHYALVDKHRISQAVANLLDNALAYTPRGGTVTLALKMNVKNPRIVVRDSGPGLRSHEMDRIWKRHSRGAAASASTPGMGLGLSLVRAIANAHDGTADCANLEASGAEFWIELPEGDPLRSANSV
jgi:signal transduction histidine kinase